MGKYFTYTEVKNFIEIESQSNCKLISKEYIKSSKKIIIECACGEQFETTLDSFKRANKRQCNKCSRSLISERYRLKYDDVKNYIEIESNSMCKLLSEEYINSGRHLKLLCRCGNIFSKSLSNFKKGQYVCNKCSKKEQIKTFLYPYEDIRNFIEFYSNSDCVLLTEEKDYVNTNNKIKIRCKCGNVFETKFQSFLHKTKRQCNECGDILRADGSRLPYDFVKNFIENIKGYKLLSDTYINSGTKLEVQCDKGHIYEVIWEDIQKGNRCPFCKETRGEKRIEEYLSLNNVQLKIEKIFLDCRYIQPLRFDFYLPEHNVLIEYQGKQHYFPVDFAGKGEEWANEQFKINQIKDQIKRDYCNNNNIKLLEIPYWDFDNIEDILSSNLLKEVG